MFTSRAEYRILLRQDNADLRLTPIAAKLGVMNMDDRMARVQEKEAATDKIKEYFVKNSAEPGLVNNYLETIGSARLKNKVKLSTSSTPARCHGRLSQSRTNSR